MIKKLVIPLLAVSVLCTSSLFTSTANADTYKSSTDKMQVEDVIPRVSGVFTVSHPNGAIVRTAPRTIMPVVAIVPAGTVLKLSSPYYTVVDGLTWWPVSSMDNSFSGWVLARDGVTS